MGVEPTADASVERSTAPATGFEDRATHGDLTASADD